MECGLITTTMAMTKTRYFVTCVLITILPPPGIIEIARLVYSEDRSRLDYDNTLPVCHLVKNYPLISDF